MSTLSDTPEHESYTPDDEKATRKTKPRKLRGLDFRIQLIFTRPKSVSLPCRTKGCGFRTSGRKPFCLMCIDKLPYVKKIKAELSSR